MRNKEAIVVLGFPMGIWSIELLSLFWQASPTEYLQKDHNLLLLIYLALFPWIMLNSVALLMVFPSNRSKAIFSSAFTLFFLAVNVYAGRTFSHHHSALSATHFVLLLFILIVGVLFTALYLLMAISFWTSHSQEREQARLLVVREELDVEAFKEKFETLGKISEYKSQLELKNRLCPICLEDFYDGIKIKVLPECRHSFHQVCLFDYWKQVRTLTQCPYCRRNVSTE